MHVDKVERREKRTEVARRCSICRLRIEIILRRIIPLLIRRRGGRWRRRRRVVIIILLLHHYRIEHDLQLRQNRRSFVKGKNTRRSLGQDHSRSPLRAARDNPTRVLGSRNKNEKQDERTRDDRLGRKNLSLLRYGGIESKLIEISVWDLPLGRKQVSGRSDCMPAISCRNVCECLKIPRGVFEKEVWLANASCGTLLIQFEFISCRKRLQLEMDMKRQKRR